MNPHHLSICAIFINFLPLPLSTSVVFQALFVVMVYSAVLEAFSFAGAACSPWSSSMMIGSAADAEMYSFTPFNIKPVYFTPFKLRSLR